MTNNTYYAVLRFGIFHSVKEYTVTTKPGHEPYNITRDAMLETYPAAHLVGFYGREDYAQDYAQKLNNEIMTKS